MNDIEAKKTLIFLIIIFWIIGVFKSLGYHLDSEWLSTFMP